MEKKWTGDSGGIKSCFCVRPDGDCSKCGMQLKGNPPSRLGGLAVDVIREQEEIEVADRLRIGM